MILDPDVPIGDDLFGAALDAALDGTTVDWPLPDPVLRALADVVRDPTEQHIAEARAAWQAARPA